VVSIVQHMNQVTLRRARLVLGWVTDFGRVYHLSSNLSPRSSQSCVPPGSLNRAPALFAGLTAGMLPLRSRMIRVPVAVGGSLTATLRLQTLEIVVVGVLRHASVEERPG